MLKKKGLWSKKGGLAMLIIGVLFFLLALLDPNFYQIVAKPDNVPIVMMVFLVGFFVWFAMTKAVRNDQQLAVGAPTFESSEVEDRIFTWPDLVFSEFICMVILTVVMVVWSIALRAPLEEPANPALAPNPSKAPWYFLGLQEMLVYFDPWLAGVLLPGLIIVGLMAIPYIDTNPKGNGYFTFRERKVEISIFLFGWLILWSQMIVIGTFLRGPNWNFFGPYEFWDITRSTRWSTSTSPSTSGSSSCTWASHRTGSSASCPASSSSASTSSSSRSSSPSGSGCGRTTRRWARRASTSASPCSSSCCSCRSRCTCAGSST